MPSSDWWQGLAVGIIIMMAIGAAYNWGQRDAKEDAEQSGEEKKESGR